MSIALEQHIAQFFAVEDMGQVFTSQRRCAAVSPQCQHHMVDLRLADRGQRRLTAQRYLDTRSVNALNQVVDQAPVGFIGQRRHPQGATELGLALPELHGVAALGQHSGGLHTGRAAAHHEDTLGRLSDRCGQQCRLLSGRGINRTAQGLVDEDLADTHIAVYAGADRLDPALAQLIGQLGVSQQLAPHGQKVKVTGSDMALCHIGLNAPHGNHRNRHRRLDRLGEIDIAAGLMNQRPFGKANGAVVGVGTHIDGTAAGLFQHD